MGGVILVVERQVVDPKLFEQELRRGELHDGDGLVLRDGRIVQVTAAPESLVEIAAPDVAALVRIAWYLGNRHLPAQLRGDRLRIRHDHVIIDIVRGLGTLSQKSRRRSIPRAVRSTSAWHMVTATGRIMNTHTDMTEWFACGSLLSPTDLLKLHSVQAWFSPSFPIGAFGYSHGLEWVVESGAVRSARSLTGWIDTARAHHGRGDRRLPAHRDPRGRLDQSRRNQADT